METVSRIDARFALSELGCEFACELMDLFAREVLLRSTRWAAGVAEETFESGGCDGPEQKQFVVVIYEAVPGVSRDEERRACFNWGWNVVEQECAAATKNIESFVGLQMTMNRDAGADGDLLSTHGEIRRARCETKFDEEVAAVAKVDEVFAAVAGSDASFGSCLSWLG